MNKSRIIKQGVFLAMVSIVMSLVAFIKETVFAYFFGVSDVADAYTIAIQVPEILFAVVWESISTILIPLYTEKIHTNDKNDSKNFISNFLTITCILSVFFIIFGEFFADWLIYLFSPGLSNETHILAVKLIRWIFPMLLFEAIIRVCTGVLNVHNSFVIPRILSGIRNIGVIIFLILFANNFGVFAAAYGVITGLFIECTLIIFSSLKYEKYVPYIAIKDPSLKKAGLMILPLFVSAGISEINQIADKMVASFLDAGSVSSLNYATKLSSIFKVILLNSVLTVIFPTFASLAAENKKKELSKAYLSTIKICLLICVPMILGGIFLRNEIVSLAFERGSFTSNSVESVAILFSVYLCTIMFITINSASIKIFAACYNTKAPVIVSTIGVGINIVLNILLSHFLGVVGLVIATLISSAITCMSLYLLIKKKIYKFSSKDVIVTIFKSIVSGVVMICSLQLLKMLIFYNYELATMFDKIIYCLIFIAVGCIVYVISLALLRVKEIKSLMQIVSKKIKRRKQG